MDTVGIPLRFVALVCDSFVFLALFFAVALTMPADGGTAVAGSTPHAFFVVSLHGAAFLIWVALNLAYFVLMEATYGATLGKLLLGLRVVDTRGHRITFGQALGRNLLKCVDLLFFGLVGAAFIWSSEYNQRLGDRAAGTFVVRHDKSYATSWS